VLVWLSHSTRLLCDFFLSRREETTLVMLPITPKFSLIRPTLSRIDSIVAAHLGETRVPGNAHPAALNRQIAMYLAKHVGGWSYKTIGRFYNGRDHSTVHYAVQRVEALRQNSPELETLLCDLKRTISEATSEFSIRRQATEMQRDSRKVVALAKNEAMLEALAERVVSKLRAEMVQILAPVRKQAEVVQTERIDSANAVEVSDLLEGLTELGRADPEGRGGAARV
jgi:Bacterial dnaA protein helix-turn-helix